MFKMVAKLRKLIASITVYAKVALYRLSYSSC